MNDPWKNARRPSSRPPRATPLPPREGGTPPPPGRGNDELRLYGWNAVQALFAKRPQALRKLYLVESLIPRMQPVLKWCVANRVGYRVVEEGDLNKLAATTHHEGLVADVLRAPVLPLAQWLAELGEGPALALWLDGVGNPHNFGAILRSAAHFGAKALLLPAAARWHFPARPHAWPRVVQSRCRWCSCLKTQKRWRSCARPVSALPRPWSKVAMTCSAHRCRPA